MSQPEVWATVERVGKLTWVASVHWNGDRVKTRWNFTLMRGPWLRMTRWGASRKARREIARQRRRLGYVSESCTIGGGA